MDMKEFIKETVQGACVRGKIREERDAGSAGRGVIKMQLPGRRMRGRPKRRFMDVIREDVRGGGDGGRCRRQEEMEMEDLTSGLLMGAAEK